MHSNIPPMRRTAEAENRTGSITLRVEKTVLDKLLRLRYGMPESPRWLLSKGRIKEANTLLVKLGLPLIQSQETDSFTIARRNVMSAFNRKVLSRTSLFIGVWFLILVPSAASTLLVVEYVNQGYTITQSVAITTIGSMGYVVGACSSIMIADKFESISLQ